MVTYHIGKKQRGCKSCQGWTVRHLNGLGVSDLAINESFGAIKKRKKRKEKKARSSVPQTGRMHATLCLYQLCLAHCIVNTVLSQIGETDRLPPIQSCIFPGLASNP